MFLSSFNPLSLFTQKIKIFKQRVKILSHSLMISCPKIHRMNGFLFSFIHLKKKIKNCAVSEKLQIETEDHSFLCNLFTHRKWQMQSFKFLIFVLSYVRKQDFLSQEVQYIYWILWISCHGHQVAIITKPETHPYTGKMSLGGGEDNLTGKAKHNVAFRVFPSRACWPWSANVAHTPLWLALRHKYVRDDHLI